MPLPWKKTKVNRISRIVADLQSPKRGGSLVVETGFPTSLIDLFVKNRDRLKKPSLKKKKKKKKDNAHQNDTTHLENDIGDLRAQDPIPANSHPGLDDSSIRVEPICEEVENSAPTESVAEEEVEEEEEEEEEEETKFESETHEDQSGVVVFLSVLKVFAVVVLALSTKKLTVGITLSAFSLLFLEYVAKRLIVRFLPFRFKKDEGELVGEQDSGSSVEEIEVVESNNGGENMGGVNYEEILNGGPDLELLCRDKKWGFLDAKEDREGEVLVVERSKSNSKRAKIRAKIIKNFVPKKLRSSKRGKKRSQDDDKVERFVEEHDQQEVGKGSHVQEIEVEEEEKGGFDKVGDENELSVVSEEEEEQEQEKIEQARAEERKGNWIYMTLFLIVLLGLFGGRVMAMPLTIAWCFVLKRFGRQRRSALVIKN